jgi:hypothetical protein
MKFIKGIQPTGPWLTDADLRHEAVIEIECPCFHDGKLKRLDIRFELKGLREHQRQHGGYMVVNKGLVRDLTDQYLMQIELTGTVPADVSHMDYPDKRFLVYTNSAFRMMHDHIIGPLKIPAPVKFIVFFAVPRVFGKQNGKHRAV